MCGVHAGDRSGTSRPVLLTLTALCGCGRPARACAVHGRLSCVRCRLEPRGAVAYVPRALCGGQPCGAVLARTKVLTRTPPGSRTLHFPPFRLAPTLTCVRGAAASPSRRRGARQQTCAPWRGTWPHSRPSSTSEHVATPLVTSEHIAAPPAQCCVDIAHDGLHVAPICFCRRFNFGFEFIFNVKIQTP